MQLLLSIRILLFSGHIPTFFFVFIQTSVVNHVKLSNRQRNNNINKIKLKRHCTKPHSFWNVTVFLSTVIKHTPSSKHIPSSKPLYAYMMQKRRRRHRDCLLRTNLGICTFSRHFHSGVACRRCLLTGMEREDENTICCDCFSPRVNSMWARDVFSKVGMSFVKFFVDCSIYVRREKNVRWQGKFQ